MATIHIKKPGEPESVRAGEPYPRPYVTLKNGYAMKYMDWFKAGQPE